MTKIVNIKDIDKVKFIQDPNYVYIGRGSKWGNPFIIGEDGNREQVVLLYDRDRISFVVEL